MIKTSALRDLCVLFLVLLFIPQSNRIVMFGSGLADWYGELLFENGETRGILAKNAGADKLRIAPTTRRHMNRTLAAPFAREIPEGAWIPPHSISYVELQAAVAGRVVEAGNGEWFEPNGLTIRTAGENHVYFVLLSLVALSFLMLGYVSASYVTEKDAFAADIERE